jgi:hypothetical protein
MAKIPDEEIISRFTYHAPTEEQQQKYAYLRNAAKILAVDINELVPESREKSLALTHLEEVVMWANAAIARHESGVMT